MARADILILGGGIIGCALAEELGRRGRSVTVLERGRIGAEASTAAAGILSAQTDLLEPGPFFDLCQLSRRMYPRWVKRLERRSGVPVAFHVDGIVYVAMTAKEEREKIRQMRWQRRRGVRVERWSRAEVLRRDPVIDGRVKSAFYFSTEAQIDNVALMRALSGTCRKAGVRLRSGVRVRRLLIEGGAVRGVATNRGVIDASVIVNCLGSWAALSEGAPPHLPVVPVRGQILAFRAPRRLLRHVLMSKRAYAVQRRDGRLLAGSTLEHAGFEKGLTVEGIQKIVSGLRQMSSAFGQSTLCDAWSGFRPHTADQMPILSSSCIAGGYVAAGHYRHGILLAPATARVMADLILTGKSAVDLRPFSIRRFF